jgi:DNA-binding FadR family transcriptional regulator
VHGVRPHDDPVPSHRAVLDAVRDADPDRAEKAMRDLLSKAARDLDTLTAD